MGKPLRNKKNKVPKISEEEYAAYVCALKTEKTPEKRQTDGETTGFVPKRTEN